MFSILMIICVICLVGFLLATYRVEEDTIMLIERKQAFHRIAHAGYNWIVPFLDSPGAIIETNTRRISCELDEQINALCKMSAKISVRFKVNLDTIVDHINGQSNVSAQFRELVADEARGFITARANHGIKTDAKTLQDKLDSDVKQLLENHGYELVALQVYEFELADENQGLNMNATITLNRILSTPMTERDPNWIEKSQTAIWEACFIEHENPESIAQDNCPYYQVRIPKRSQNFSGPAKFQDLVDRCFKKGTGLMLYTGTSEQPSWALTYGDIIQIQQHQKLPKYMGISQHNNKPLDLESMIPMGQPDTDLFPESLRNIVNDYLHQIGIETPAVMQATILGSDLSMSLVFNVFASDFETLAEYDRVKYQLRWLMPANIQVLYAKNPDDFADSFEPIEAELA